MICCPNLTTELQNGADLNQGHDIFLDSLLNLENQFRSP